MFTMFGKYDAVGLQENMCWLLLVQNVSFFLQRISKYLVYKLEVILIYFYSNCQKTNSALNVLVFTCS